MSTLNQNVKESFMKRYLVNDNCIGCGLCVSICPEVFEMDESELARARDDEIDGDLEERADEAKSSCPVDAIEDKPV